MTFQTPQRDWRLPSRLTFLANHQPVSQLAGPERGSAAAKRGGGLLEVRAGGVCGAGYMIAAGTDGVIPVAAHAQLTFAGAADALGTAAFAEAEWAAVGVVSAGTAAAAAHTNVRLVPA